VEYDAGLVSVQTISVNAVVPYLKPRLPALAPPVASMLPANIAEVVVTKDVPTVVTVGTTIGGAVGVAVGVGQGRVVNESKAPTEYVGFTEFLA
jgi:hypothetical protein